MKKGISTLILFITAVFFMSVTVLIAATEPPDTVVIDNKGYKKDKEEPYTFHHKKHVEEYEAACTECHHDYDENGKNTWKEGDEVKKCIECHDPKKKQGDAPRLDSAYHKNCRDCHKEVDPKSEKAPWKKCSDCHPR